MDDQNSRVKLGKEGWTPVAMWQASKTAFLCGEDRVWLHLRQVEDVATCLRACGLSYKTVPGEPDIGAAYKTYGARRFPRVTSTAPRILLTGKLKKKAYESNHSLYDHALVDRTCQKWFAQFKSSNFDLEDDERPGALLKFEGSMMIQHKRKRNSQKHFESLNQPFYFA
ncbi:SETMAR [Cordylochernes scorpioides]|uniref:SETMAR n=1 Tax=Cordylochernes scorpioides TaxID=51811 RepID=A0ABY6L2G1_9ARAC|nr:SETMAR [Cordylochernes scorpioides]